MGPDEIVGKKKRKAKNWPAGSETISRSRMPKMTSRLRNVTYEIPRNPSWAPGIAMGRNRAPTRGSSVSNIAAGKGQYQEVRVLIQRKAWATLHWKRPQATTDPDIPDLREPAGAGEPPVTRSPSDSGYRQEMCDGPVLDDQHRRGGEQDPRAQKPSHRRISKVGRAMYRRMPK